MRDHPRSGCPINAGLEALGDPWALLVLRDVMFGNRRHFRELLEHSKEGIASNILASRLKALVAGGLLTRDDAVRGQRAAYSLTEAGIQTVPVMVALGSWGLAHRSGTPELRIRAELLRDGGPELSEQFMDELRETHLGTPRRRADQPTASEQLERAYEQLAGSDAAADHVDARPVDPRLSPLAAAKYEIVPLEKKPRAATQTEPRPGSGVFRKIRPVISTDDGALHTTSPHERDATPS